MGAFATGAPLLPPSYIAGTITISASQASTPQELLTLIQAQLDANCPGVCRALSLQIDTTVLYGGCQSQGGTGGTSTALSTSNYGWELTSTFPIKTWGSDFPGSQVPVGNMQIFMAAGTFHVEVLV
jgi:hypothetical protein